MKRCVQWALERMGCRLVRLNDLRRSPLQDLLRLLRRFDFAPNHILDVGANRGMWTRQALEIFPDAHYTLLEPQQELHGHLDDCIAKGAKIRWMPVGAGKHSGTHFLTVYANDVGSSFVPTQDEAKRGGYRQIAVKVETLNAIVASSELPAPEMIKIDAEGWDLQVLEGASDLIGKTEIILIEAGIFARDLENHLSAVMRRMDALNYQVFDFTDLNRSPKHGVLWLCEMAFLRKGSHLFDAVDAYE